MAANQTWRNGRYTGKGDPIEDIILGQHDATGPLYYHRPEELSALLYNRLDTSGGRGVTQRSSAGIWSEADYTRTNDGAGTTAPAASAPLILTSANTSGNKSMVQFLQAWTPTARGNRAWFMARVALSAATTTQHFWAGFTTASTDPVGSAPTNSLVLKKASGAATMLGAATGASDTATLLTLASDTYYDIGAILTPTSTTAVGIQWFIKSTLASAWTKTAQSATITAGALRFMLFTQTAASSARTATIARYAFGFED